MLKNEKGFTLVELLAVLVILAIILTIAIPSITSIVDSTKKSAFESDVKMLIKGVEYKLLQDPGFADGGYTEATVATVDEVGGDSNQYDHFEITKINPVTITVVARKGGKFGRLCVQGATFSNIGTVIDDEEDCNELIPTP